MDQQQDNQVGNSVRLVYSVNSTITEPVAPGRPACQLLVGVTLVRVPINIVVNDRQPCVYFCTRALTQYYLLYSCLQHVPIIPYSPCDNLIDQVWRKSQHAAVRTPSRGDKTPFGTPIFGPVLF